MIDLSKMDEFTAQFFKVAFKMMENSKMNEDTEITPDNVFQPAYKKNRDMLFDAVKVAHLEGSAILGAENILKLHELAASGKSCLILSEHVSNFDVPSMFVRFYEHPDKRLADIFEKIIFIAGVKLNEDPLVKMYTEMFTRVVIYPIRSINKMQDKEEHKDEIELAKKINLRATRKIRELRNAGNIFLLYPAGTRYRPWAPETKKGIKETASYLNSFDYFCCSSINGNNMPPMQHENMTGETIVKDLLVFNFGEVRSTKEFIKNIPQSGDKESDKERIVEKVMSDIDALHNEAEKYREKNLVKK